MTTPPDITVILPAHNEAATIGACLRHVLASDGPNSAQVIVVANGCVDETASKARDMKEAFDARGWVLEVIDLKEGSKTGALNAGDAVARSNARAYLDADVLVSPGLLPQLAKKLATDEPLYASGTLRLAHAQSPVTRAYARIYAQVPFISQGVPGAGVFAMNRAGRARWDNWPDIISDDTFARLNFTPEERQKVPAGYDWPLVEGWRALVRVRRRQNRGVREIAERYPHLLQNDDRRRINSGMLAHMALRNPIGFLVYVSVTLATKFGKTTGWDRGR